VRKACQPLIVLRGGLPCGDQDWYVAATVNPPAAGHGRNGVFIKESIELFLTEASSKGEIAVTEEVAMKGYNIHGGQDATLSFSAGRSRAPRCRHLAIQEAEHFAPWNALRHCEEFG